MNQAVQKYRKQVLRAMPCPAKEKKVLIEHLDSLLISFQQDEPNADEAKVLEAFGTPTELAQTLCEGYSEAEQQSWHRRRWIRRLAILVFCAGMIAFLSYAVALCTAESPVYTKDKIYVYQSNSSSQFE